MTSTVIHHYVTHFLKEEMRQVQSRLLARIGKDYGICVKELELRYGDICLVDETETVQVVRKREYNKNLIECNRCCALNARKQRCKRSKLKREGATFCVAHREKQPYGIYHKATEKA